MIDQAKLAAQIAKDNLEAEDWAPVDNRWRTTLYHASKKNARVRSLTWDLTRDQFDQLIDGSGMRCAVTGIPFDMSPVVGAGMRRPFYPSLDRRDSLLGYEISNCRMVCVAANIAMQQWGEEVLRRLAIGFFQHQNLNRSIQRGMMNEVLPENVTVYRGLRKVSYRARVRRIDGKDISLGTFGTAAEAAEAQAKWRRENGLEFPVNSLRV